MPIYSHDQVFVETALPAGYHGEQDNGVAHLAHQQ